MRSLSSLLHFDRLSDLKNSLHLAFGPAFTLSTTRMPILGLKNLEFWDHDTLLLLPPLCKRSFSRALRFDVTSAVRRDSAMGLAVRIREPLVFDRLDDRPNSDLLTDPRSFSQASIERYKNFQAVIWLWRTDTWHDLCKAKEPTG